MNHATSYVQVVGGGMVDGGGKAIIISFDQRSYLINCGEGFQRNSTENSIKLVKLRSIFLTSLDWLSSSGGLAGLLCTVGDSSPGGIGSISSSEEDGKKINIIGPPHLHHFIASQRPFIRRSHLTVNVTESPIGSADAVLHPLYKDNYIEVKGLYLNLLSSSSSDCHHITNAKSFMERMFKMKMGTEDDNNGSANGIESKVLLDKIPSINERYSGTLCLRIQGPKIIGKFEPLKALALNIKAGPLWGRLQRGEDVIRDDDGAIIKSSQCVSPPQEGPLLFVLDIASQQCQDVLESNLTVLFNDLGDRTSIIVVYLAPPSIDISATMRKISILTKCCCENLWINTGTHNSNKELIFSSASKILCELNSTINEAIFNPPIYGMNDCVGGGCVGGDCIDKKSLQHLHRIKWMTNNFEQEIPPSPEMMKECLKFIQKPKGLKDDPIITFLGTGGGLPGKYRNVSATLVDFGDEAILLDCGEGTYGQGVRMWGLTGWELVLKRVSVIFISHLHADHHLGLLSLLSGGERGEKKSIVAPQRFLTFLQECIESLPLVVDYKFIANEGLEDFPVSDVIRATSVPVIHCPSAYGFIIRRCDVGIQFVYSGDTRPCNALAEKAIKSGREVSFLVHEATFTSCYQEEAEEKMHSTLEEAIGIGWMMRAKIVFLTHISQRFSKTLPFPYDWECGEGVVYGLNGDGDGDKKKIISMKGKLLPVIDFMSISLKESLKIDLTRLISQMRQVMREE